MTASSQPRTTRVVFLVNRVPAIDRQVDLPSGLVMMTDTEGAIDLALPAGRYQGVIHLESEKSPFEVALAAGLSEVAVRLTCEVKVDLDPRVQASMPSDRYRPVALLGRGAAGSVYRCFDETLRREIAVKLLDQTIGTSSSEREAFLQEGRALAAIEHPNLIDIFDLGFHNGRGFMVMQFVDGPDLDRLLQSDGRLSFGAAAAVGVQLARALDALHRGGLLHRDVKPSNGLVDRSGIVRLADFGLVRPILDFSDPRSKVFGTPAYMSPEQLQALQLGPASDVYGLGATLYHLATGKLAFGGTNMILSHVMEPPPDPRADVPDMPAELADVILSMMQKEPSERITALEAAVALAEIASRVESPGRGLYQPRLASSEGNAPLSEPKTRLLPLTSDVVPIDAPAPRHEIEEVEETHAPKRRWLVAVALVVAGLTAYGASEFGDPSPNEEVVGATSAQGDQVPAATQAADPAPATEAQEPTERGAAISPSADGSGSETDTPSTESATVEQDTPALSEAEASTPSDSPNANGTSDGENPLEGRTSRREQQREDSPQRREQEEAEVAASESTPSNVGEPAPSASADDNPRLPERGQSDLPAVAGAEPLADPIDVGEEAGEDEATSITNEDAATPALEAAAGQAVAPDVEAAPSSTPEPPPALVVVPPIAAPAEPARSESEAEDDEQEEDGDRPRRRRSNAPPLGF